METDSGGHKDTLTHTSSAQPSIRVWNAEKSEKLIRIKILYNTNKNVLILEIFFVEKVFYQWKDSIFGSRSCWRLLLETLVSGKLINPLNQPDFLWVLTIVFAVSAVCYPHCSPLLENWLFSCHDEQSCFNVQWVI